MTSDTSTISDKYEVFIAGETVDLVLPNERAIDDDGWHKWLNDPDINKYTGYGKIPNTAEKQRAFLKELLSPQSNRFGLLLVPKGSDKAIGIISLSAIDMHNRKGDTALIIGTRKRSANSVFHGIEAKARLVEHAFTVMGLERVQGSQVTELYDWQRYQVLFGFRPEGLRRRSFRRGREVYDTVLTACTLEDYDRVIAARGSYWPGKKKLLELMRDLPKTSVVDQVGDAMEKAVSDYMQGVKLG